MLLPTPEFMKMVSGLARLTRLSASGDNPAFVFVLILTAALFSSGCSKGRSTVQAPVPQPALDTNQTSVAMPQVAEYAPAVVAVSPDGGADLKQLNHAYIHWIVQNRRSPKSFEEFVASSGIQVPPPPSGKKYVIDKYGFINLANN
jgi:hypothetical protein